MYGNVMNSGSEEGKLLIQKEERHSSWAERMHSCSVGSAQQPELLLQCMEVVI